MASPLRERHTLLSISPLLSSLGPVERDTLIGQSAFFEVATGEAVVREGAIGTAAFVVLVGRVKVETGHGSSQPVLLEILGPGGLFGELALLAQRPPSADVIALEDTTLLRIDNRDLRSALERNPDFAMALLENLATRVIAFGDAIRSFAVADLEARLAGRICSWADLHGTLANGEIALDLGITQRDWAHMAGTSRESVNRLFRSWTERGWITLEGGRLRILRIESIRDVANRAGLIAS